MNTLTASRKAAQKLAADRAIGLTVDQQLRAQVIEQRELAALLGVSGPSVSKKLRGLVGWSATELLVTAEFLGVKVEDLMPTWHEKAPGSENGFEGWVPAPYVPGLSRTISFQEGRQLSPSVP